MGDIGVEQLAEPAGEHLPERRELGEHQCPVSFVDKGCRDVGQQLDLA